MKRVHIEILAGTILVLLSAVILIVMAVREPQRLADYEIQQGAAQIEFGAGVFETNCTRCHGSSATGSVSSTRGESGTGIGASPMA